MENCNKCNQTIKNCECHIPLEEKHKGLYSMTKQIPQLLQKMNNPLNAPWTKEPQVGRGAWIKDCNGNWVAMSCGRTETEGETNANRIILIPDLAQSLIDTIEGFEQLLKETNNPNSVDDFTFIKRAKEVLNKLG